MATYRTIFWQWENLFLFLLVFFFYKFLFWSRKSTIFCYIYFMTIANKSLAIFLLFTLSTNNSQPYRIPSSLLVCSSSSNSHNSILIQPPAHKLWLNMTETSYEMCIIQIIVTQLNGNHDKWLWRIQIMTILNGLAVGPKLIHHTCKLWWQAPVICRTQ